MAVSAVSATSSDSASGLDFKSLMQIILQQLTYQDPLKPMDNFQFVSQMAQFSELQQIQSLNTSISTLLDTQSSLQATGLLGKTVDFTTTGSTNAIGTVKSVTFASGKPSLTIATSDGQTVANVELSAITQVQ
ncbi:flagellar hook assembly protein FlgD [Asticcacaulis solisilvae]|uniref:flagellar hook assembly protein FlgD n=1 Tax=Asticcacaulis solisilvae TaxID=1217274 RepID=UPI003FD6C11C